MQKKFKRGGGKFNDTIGPSKLVNTLMIRTRLFLALGYLYRFPKLFTGLYDDEQIVLFYRTVFTCLV